MTVRALVGASAVVAAFMAPAAPGNAATLLPAHQLDRVTAGQLDPRAARPAGWRGQSFGAGGPVSPAVLGGGLQVGNASPLARGPAVGPLFIGLWGADGGVSTSQARSTSANP